MRETLQESTRNLDQKHLEEISLLQEKIRKTAEQRQHELERSRNTINALQQQIDKVVSEKNSVQLEYM